MWYESLAHLWRFQTQWYTVKSKSKPSQAHVRISSEHSDTQRRNHNKCLQSFIYVPAMICAYVTHNSRILQEHGVFRLHGMLFVLKPFVVLKYVLSCLGKSPSFICSLISTRLEIWIFMSTHACVLDSFQRIGCTSGGISRFISRFDRSFHVMIINDYVSS